LLCPPHSKALEQNPSEILENLKKQRKGKVVATATAGYLSIAAIIGLVGGVLTNNRLMAFSAMCWLGSNVIASIASKETQERHELERRIEFVIAASELSKQAKDDVFRSLGNDSGLRNRIGLN
jgi:hypothetical protein